MQKRMSALFQLPLDYAVWILVLFGAFFAIHWLRRSFREPVRQKPTTAVEVPGENVKAFGTVQRLFHWSLFVVLGLVAFTGIDIFAPGVLGWFLSPFGISSVADSLFWHTTLLWVLLGMVVIHVAWDLAVARGWHNIWPGRRDFSDTGVRLKNFFGATKEYPRSPKYDPFMKVFHWGTALSFVVLGISGIYLWNPYGLLPAVAPGFMNTLRLFHDVFAFLFVGLILGHIYFAVLPVNWPILRSMATGTLSKEEYESEFDADRWPVANLKPTLGAPMPAAALRREEVERP